MSHVQEFSTSPTCRNGFDIGVKDGYVCLVREFWSNGANQRVYKENPEKGEGLLTRKITKSAMVTILSNGSPDTIKELYLSLDKKGKALMKKAQRKLIKKIKKII